MMRTDFISLVVLPKTYNPGCCCQITSVVSDSVRPHGLQPTRLLHPWDSPGKNTGVGCHFLLQCMKVERESEVAQSCLTLSDPMDCSLPGSSIHGIFQARVLEWVAIAFSITRASHDKNINPTQNEGHSIKYLTSSKLSKSSKEGKSEKLSQARGSWGDTTVKDEVVSWVRSGNREDSGVKPVESDKLWVLVINHVLTLLP